MSNLNKEKIESLEIELDSAKTTIINLTTEKLKLQLECTHYQQTIRSLHWALNVATSEIRRVQKRYASNFLDGTGPFEGVELTD